MCISIRINIQNLPVILLASVADKVIFTLYKQLKQSLQVNEQSNSVDIKAKPKKKKKTQQSLQGMCICTNANKRLFSRKERRAI